MKRVIVVFVMLVWAGVVSYGEALDWQGASTVIGDAGVPPAEPAPATQPQPRQPPPPPPPPDTRPRRIGSMVGYLDDAIIESQVRVRFEVGLGMRRPDRAEFFYAKCGCYRDLANHPTLGVFHDPNSPGPGPTSPAGIVDDMNFRQLMIEAEYAATDRISVFAEAPIRWIQPQDFLIPAVAGTFGNQGGFGDLRAGAKVALAASPDYSVTFRFQAFFPTGSASKGLGTDHASVEPSVLYFQKFPNTEDRLAIESQFGVWLPTGGSDGARPGIDDNYSGNVLFYGIGPSYVVYESDALRIAPVVELIGWSVLSGFEAPPNEAAGTGTEANSTIVNLKIGARFNFRQRSSLYVGYGHALTDESWYDDIVRIEYRYGF
jgi:hypothetical protein